VVCVYVSQDITNGKFIGELLHNGTRGSGPNAWERVRGEWVSRQCSKDKVDTVIISQDKYVELQQKCEAYRDKIPNGRRQYPQGPAMNPIHSYYTGTGSDIVFSDQKNSAFQVGDNLMDHFTVLKAWTQTTFKAGNLYPVFKKPAAQCVQ